jgi:hypothetical protein
MKRLLMVIFLNGLLSGPVIAAQNQLLFMGLTGQGAPASSRSFEQRLRNELSMLDRVTVVDYVETQRYREMADFNRYPATSEKMLQSLLKFIPDSMLIVWGSINNIELNPIRKNIFGAAIEGKLSVGIAIYNLQQRGYSYNGNVQSTITAKEHPIYFSPVKKVIHISASRRAALTDSLISLAVFNSIAVIESVLKNRIRVDTNKDSINNVRSNAPSISDIFTVPSIEAAQIERGNSKGTNKNTTPTTDTVKTTKVK